MKPDKYNLMSRPKEELIAIIEKLTDGLSEKDRQDFLAKWISPQAALDEAQERYAFLRDSGDFLKKVEAFCSKCMEGDYYYEPDYEQYHAYYNDDHDIDFGESEWAGEFASLLKFSVIYSKIKNYDISYTAFERLMGCLHEAEFDEAILGTENPMANIEIDWDEVFEEYYLSMRNQIPDIKQFAGKAVDVWVRFGEECTDYILNSFDDIAHIEESIKKNIADLTDCWLVQHVLYELLKKFYIKLGLELDEIEAAKSLVCYNLNFEYDVAQGYMDRGMWDEAVLTIKKTLKEVTFEPLVLALNSKLTDCFEHLNRFDEAYDVAVHMFELDYSHMHYLKARGCAVKLDKLKSFIARMEEYIQSAKIFDSVKILLRILSYEGHTAKLIDTALKSDGYSRHDHLKYTSKSLVYQALGSENNSLPNLKEYIQTIENDKIEGIVDMVKTPEDSDEKQFLLKSAAEILKLMVQFHIDAACRNRYARAAYYCAVIKDIYTTMNEEEEFNRYYEQILTENKRRPALKDEMKQKIR